MDNLGADRVESGEGPFTFKGGESPKGKDYRHPSSRSQSDGCLTRTSLSPRDSPGRPPKDRNKSHRVFGRVGGPAPGIVTDGLERRRILLSWMFLLGQPHLKERDLKV